MVFVYSYNMDVTQLGNMLKSKTRVNILRILDDKSLRAIDVYNQYKALFKKDAKHREFIYKELERLVDSGILDKKYDNEIKGITYTLKFRMVSVNLLNGEVNTK
jgi:Fe2+ or Zn2+ uptake regulation protein